MKRRRKPTRLRRLLRQGTEPRHERRRRCLQGRELARLLKVVLEPQRRSLYRHLPRSWSQGLRGRSVRALVATAGHEPAAQIVAHGAATRRGVAGLTPVTGAGVQRDPGLTGKNGVCGLQNRFPRCRRCRPLHLRGRRGRAKRESKFSRIAGTKWETQEASLASANTCGGMNYA